MPKKFNSVEERRAYWNDWHERNKHREDYKKAQSETKKRIRKERRDWFQELKKKLKCERCGIDDFRVLDFHHLDPNEKDLEVSNMVRLRWSKKKILAEIAKCQCLCANCHRIVHWEEKDNQSVA
jgi:hypothetical protein